MSAGAVRKYGIIYPMIEWGMTKRDVAIEMKSWPFDLDIPGDHFGNCTWCWKKTDRKLYTLAIEDPSVFDVPKRLEEKYGHIDALAGRKCCDQNGRAQFFRKHRSAEDIIREASETQFEPYSDDPHEHAYDFDESLDVGGACGESCEAWADGD